MMKLLKQVWCIVFPLVGWIGVILLGGTFLLSQLFPWEYEELGRALSPDGRLEAVITRANAGAMTRYRYGVCVVSNGTRFNPKDAVFDSEELSPSDIAWTSPIDINITQAPGRVRYYESIWPFPPNGESHPIRIHLIVDYGRVGPDH